MSWTNVSGKRGSWSKAKEGENFHGYSNNENEKPLETLLNKPPSNNDGSSIKGFFIPGPKKW